MHVKRRSKTCKPTPIFSYTKISSDLHRSHGVSDRRLGDKVPRLPPPPPVATPLSPRLVHRTPLQRCPNDRASKSSGDTFLHFPILQSNPNQSEKNVKMTWCTVLRQNGASHAVATLPNPPERRNLQVPLFRVPNLSIYLIPINQKKTPFLASVSPAKRERAMSRVFQCKKRAVI